MRPARSCFDVRRSSREAAREVTPLSPGSPPRVTPAARGAGAVPAPAFHPPHPHSNLPTTHRHGHADAPPAAAPAPGPPGGVSGASGSRAPAALPAALPGGLCARCRGQLSVFYALDPPRGRVRGLPAGGGSEVDRGCTLDPRPRIGPVTTPQCRAPGRPAQPMLATTSAPAPVAASQGSCPRCAAWPTPGTRSMPGLPHIRPGRTARWSTAPVCLRTLAARKRQQVIPQNQPLGILVLPHTCLLF